MKKRYFKYLAEILVLSMICSIIIAYFSQEKGEIAGAQDENNQNFQSAYVSQSALVGIAFSTNIGLGNGFISGNETGSYAYVSFLWVDDETRMEIRKNLISQNMIQVREYLNFSKTDYAQVIKSSSDRKTTVEALIAQLELRKNLASASISNLEKTKNELITSLEATSSNIEKQKAAMSTNFSGNKVDATLGNIDAYFSLRDDYTQDFTDIVFINQFLKQYSFLIQYNEGILDTIKLNKEAIINESYVVIPNSGGAYLEPLNLLYSEDDIQSLEKEE